MVNIVWLILMLSSIVVALINGTTTSLINAITTSAVEAIQLIIYLIGVIAFWMGLMRVAEQSGLISALASLMRPIFNRLFDEVPEDDEALGSITLNIAANMLGLGNAATSFGLKAMDQLQRLNKSSKSASNAMCTFLAINTSSVQIIPTTAMAILASNGDPNPTRIVFPILVATLCSTVAGIVSVKFLEKRKRYRMPNNED